MPHDPATATSWTLTRGAQIETENDVRFTLWAPRQRTPRVRVLDGPAAGEYAMTPSPDNPGEHTVCVPHAGPDASYFYITDDGRELPDPLSRWQPDGVHGPSRVVDPRAFIWSDADWRGLTLEDLVIYEIHVGTFTPHGTLAAVIPRLAELKSLGVTAIELMPVAQFPGARNWGYDGVDLYAVQNTYGGPDELRRVIDAAHGVGLGVILDVVYNHVGPEGNYLDAFGPYFTEKYRTPWGRALNFDDADSDEVRRFIIDNARYWISEYHVDGLRLDAVHGIFDFSARHLLDEIADAAHTAGEQADRAVLVIAESDLNDPKLVRDRGVYGFGLDAQWSDDFHHAVHAVLTGERNGYYTDFGDVAEIANALREPFVYAGRYSPHRRRRHGAASVGIPRQRFVVAVQNHDQVGNRAAGERLATLLTPDQLRLAAALLLLSPYVPLLFMGEEYGETNPFLYFIDHTDDDLVDAVRRGRRREFEAFGWSDDVPDPQAPETFERSKIDWSKATAGTHARLLMLYRDLLALRRESSLLRPDGGSLAVAHGEPGWITVLREPFFASQRGEPSALLTAFNCSASAADVPLPGSPARAWTLRLSTDAFGYGGSGGTTETVAAGAEPDGPRRLLADAPRTVRVPAWSAAVYDTFDVWNY
jgi:maltooligosyltrehalose trehalohydrolase